jgi:hypothetical protein
MNPLLILLRWLAGCEPETIPIPNLVDDLEPYCSQKRLQERIDFVGPLPSSPHKAISKIAARYGAIL